MADLGKLKRRADKGAPPAPERTNTNLRKPARGGRQSKAYLQFFGSGGVARRICHGGRPQIRFQERLEVQIVHRDVGGLQNAAIRIAGYPDIPLS